MSTWRLGAIFSRLCSLVPAYRSFQEAHPVLTIPIRTNPRLFESVAVSVAEFPLTKHCVFRTRDTPRESERVRVLDLVFSTEDFEIERDVWYEVGGGMHPTIARRETFLLQ